MSDFQNESVSHEYLRWRDKIGQDDPYHSRFTIGIHEVIFAHFLLVDYFYTIKEGIGGVGPKNIDLLHSAVGRQFSEFAGSPKWKDRIDIVATTLFGLVKNHPFYDANKRTGFLVSVLHLQKIGRTPIVSSEEYEDFIVDISNDNLKKYNNIFNKDVETSDLPVFIISSFLRKKTRPMDNKPKFITYNQLSSIIGKYGFKLENPKSNKIDLIKYENNNSYRVAHIGFHGWSKQVSLGVISTVREACKLDARHGFDSQSFYSGVDTPLALIEKYREPLERLAFR